ncbi:unnamed protein product [Larinioides sclopetarius]|uniref:Bestrophin homolog n=2 Tax=Larinioides sclopetarius TaxID=280406 RepID=A0AAV1ZSF2_9ARAC
MTITYQKNVSNTSFMGFAKLLFKWKGSIYKLVFRELIMYGSAFAIISICYRFIMADEQKRQFEKVAMYCDQTAGLMPMSFVLGFYVTFVVTRWWNQFLNLPWPDRAAHTILMYVHGTDDRSRIIRRTLVRYINLANIILFQTISGSAKKRFPTMDHVVGAGLMTPEEKQLYDSCTLNVNKHWVPFVWSINLINVAVKEGKMSSGEPVKQFLDELNSLRTKTGHLWGHDWVTVPLVYTQVVTLLTHLYFFTCLIGRQFLDPAQGYPGHDIDLYFPVYTFLQFFFFLGWLKVAEQLINPFGEDDDDFETNWFIDRNIQVCYTIVDDMYGKLAKLDKDPHWGLSTIEIPYTEASLIHKIANYKGSTMDVKLSPKEQTMVYYELGDPRLLTHPPSLYRRFRLFLSRHCGSCYDLDQPPMNKPIGESYGRTEPLNFEQYDNPNHRKVSNYSLFGDGYFNIINRPGKRGSLTGDASHQGVLEPMVQHHPSNSPVAFFRTGRRGSTISEPGNLSGSETNPLTLTVPNNNYNRRHRPSAVAAHVLTSVSETEQEESDPEPSPADTVKMALAFLDEDLEDIVSVQKP